MNKGVEFALLILFLFSYIPREKNNLVSLRLNYIISYNILKWGRGGDP